MHPKTRRLNPTLVKQMFKNVKKALGGNRSLYKTKGYVGKFRSRRPTRGPSAYRAFGSFKKLEHGGVVNSDVSGTDSRVTYLGHSTFVRNEISRSVARAVVRKLALMAKLHFQSWGEIVNDTSGGYFYEVTYFETLSSTSPVVASSPKLDANKLWQEHADEMEKLINNTVSGTVSDIPEFVQFRLLRDNPLGTGDPVDERTIATLNAKDIRLHLMMTSAMSLQNRTKATNAVGDENADNMNDIENNPLVGKRYNFRGNSTYEKSDRYARIAAALSAGVSDGFIRFTPSTPTQLARWHKPPNGNYLYECFKTGKVTLAPGQIKKSFLKTVKTMKFQQYVYMFRNNMKQFTVPSSDPVRCRLGESEVLGLEKILDSRASTEDKISIGWQIDYTIGSYITYHHRPTTNTIMEVDPVAVPQI